jgi:hypothetical protein
MQIENSKDFLSASASQRVNSTYRVSIKYDYCSLFVQLTEFLKKSFFLCTDPVFQRHIQ